MINRKYIAIAVALIVFIISGCTATTPAHVYRIKEEATFIAVCSDTASVEEIGSHVARHHSEYGESTGLIWQPDSQCVTFDK